MNMWLVFGIALALAMDCFAVSLGLSIALKGMTIRRSAWIGLHFGLFQLAMMIAGWFAGESLLRLVKGFDHWAAFGLLAFIGGRMIHESFEREDEDGPARPNPVGGLRLLVLALATSIDSLAVGLGLGVIGSLIILPAVIIGAVSFVMTIIGARLGPVVGKIIGKRAELVGGLILIGIGLRILIEHLAA